MDGTLLDTLADIAEVTNRVLQRHGYPLHPMDQYRFFVGQGAGKLIEQVLPDKAREESIILACVKDFMIEYEKSWNHNTALYDGIADLLNELEKRGIRKSILSNKPDDFTKAFAREYLNNWTFDEIHGNSKRFPRKPDPAGALLIAEELGLVPDEIIYIGDTAIDMKTAVAAGMKPVGVLWGFRDREELLANGARELLENPMDLFDKFEI